MAWHTLTPKIKCLVYTVQVRRNRRAVWQLLFNLHYFHYDLCQSGSGIQVYFSPVIPTISSNSQWGSKWQPLLLYSRSRPRPKLGLKLTKPIKSNPVNNNRKATVIQMTEGVKRLTEALHSNKSQQAAASVILVTEDTENQNESKSLLLQFASNEVIVQSQGNSKLKLQVAAHEKWPLRVWLNKGNKCTSL